MRRRPEDIARWKREREARLEKCRDQLATAEHQRQQSAGSGTDSLSHARAQILFAQAAFECREVSEFGQPASQVDAAEQAIRTALATPVLRAEAETWCQASELLASVLFERSRTAPEHHAPVLLDEVIQIRLDLVRHFSAQNQSMQVCRMQFLLTHHAGQYARLCHHPEDKRRWLQQAVEYAESAACTYMVHTGNWSTMVERALDTAVRKLAECDKAASAIPPRWPSA